MIKGYHFKNLKAKRRGRINGIAYTPYHKMRRKWSFFDEQGFISSYVLFRKYWRIRNRFKKLTLCKKQNKYKSRRLKIRKHTKQMFKNNRIGFGEFYRKHNTPFLRGEMYTFIKLWRWVNKMYKHAQANKKN